MIISNSWFVSIKKNVIVYNETKQTLVDKMVLPFSNIFNNYLYNFTITLQICFCVRKMFILNKFAKKKRVFFAIDYTRYRSHLDFPAIGWEALLSQI